jgi:fibronectin type 3 domain-containing protein
MCLAGCGYVGQVQPPSLDIPQKVVDLRAAEEGGQIAAEFTIADKTTENLPLKGLRAVELFAGSDQGAGEPEGWSASATRYAVQASGPGALTQQFPAQAWVGKTLVLRVRATGPKGKRSLWSDPFVLNVIAPLARPSTPAAESRKDGVRLTWSGAAPHYRIFRAVGDAAPQPLAGDADKPEYLDDSAQFGTTYKYYVMALASETQRSEVSEPSAAITPVDKFPPDVPMGVTAVAGPNAIELAWPGNTEPDFRGYNVYRSVNGGPFEKIATLIEAPVYSDAKVEAGKMYRYSVSAVDLSGNESERSAVATPAQ